MKTKVVQSSRGLTDGTVAVGQEMHVIRTEGLSKSFGDVRALTDLNLDVPARSIFGFLGPNGAGKSTAIKLLLGLSRPSAGRATLFGMEHAHDSLAIRSRIGYLAQDPQFYPYLTARQTLEFTAGFFYAGTTQAVRHRVDEMLELVGLEQKAERPIRGFSGGERQRLGIAQAQVNHPDLLVLDEPAAALDPLGRRDVLDVMERLREDTTIFYSTHILDDVEQVSDHVAILDHGRLVTAAATHSLLDGRESIYDVSVLGDGLTVVERLEDLPWVDTVSAAPESGTGDGPRTRLQVTVSDEREAESSLLRTVLADDTTVVREFGRTRLDLEEVFLALVDREQPGR
jgi:ABC-2 type transport system ATP-binding protein